jgi:hypothetical protein
MADEVPITDIVFLFPKDRVLKVPLADAMEIFVSLSRLERVVSLPFWTSMSGVSPTLVMRTSKVQPNPVDEKTGAELDPKTLEPIAKELLVSHSKDVLVAGTSAAAMKEQLAKASVEVSKLTAAPTAARVG